MKCFLLTRSFVVLSISLILLSAIPLRAQMYQIQWADTIDNGSSDNAQDITVDARGNVYVTGYSKISSNNDYLTVKYDSLGNIIWMDTLDYSEEDDAHGIAVDTSGNIYVTGMSNFCCLTVEYDPLGNIIWADTFHSGSYNYGYHIAVDNKNNIYVAGAAYINYQWRWLAIKYDSSRNIAWIDTINNGHKDAAYGIAVDANGNVYVTGFSQITTDDDYLTVKYDPSGNIVWADTINNDSNDISIDIAVDNDDNTYITGEFYVGSNYDYLTVKYDSLGNIIWADTLDSGGQDYGYSVTVDSSDNVYVTGEANNHYLTVKYDSSGNIVWADTLNSNGGAHGIALDGSGNAYVTGSSNNNYLTVKYVKYKDAGITSIASPDTAFLDSIYISQIWVKNNSYEDTLNFDVAAYIDSLGGNVYTDTQHVSTLPPGDSVIVSFIQWTTPSDSMVLTLGFSILTADMNPDNDTLSEPLYVYAYKDAGIISIASLDTVCTDSSYTPRIWVKNNSYKDTLNFFVAAYIDSTGGNLYADTQSVSNLPMGDSVLVNFHFWTAPSSPMDLDLNFSIITSDMNTNDDTLSKTLYVWDLVSPVVDSAIASDGTNPISGIDDDDYVILYFSEPTNKPAIDNTNIDSVFSVSNGHSWLDGFGALGTSYWNPDGTQLLINLTTNVSLPTIAVGDTITLDGSTITDTVGNFCSSKVVLSGSFDPSGIANKKKPIRTMLNVSSINSRNISFSYSVAHDGYYSIALYSIDGKTIKKIEGKTRGFYSERISNIPKGIYFLRFEQGNKMINKKVIKIR